MCVCNILGSLSSGPNLGPSYTVYMYKYFTVHFTAGAVYWISQPTVLTLDEERRAFHHMEKDGFQIACLLSLALARNSLNSPPS